MKKITLLLIVIGFIVSCSKDKAEVDNREFVPKQVIVGFKSETDINQIFDFINLYGHKVSNLDDLIFTSRLPSDSLQYVIDKLNEKVYIKDEAGWPVHGFIHDNKIRIYPRLYDMDNINYQNDWLQTMQTYQLDQEHTANDGGVALFYVPAGEEKEWRNIFNTHDIVDWAELNYILHINPDIN